MSTEAGKRLYNGYIRDGVAHVAEAADIAAIEAEARRAALTSLRERVAGLHRPGRSDVNFRAVLAEIDRALGD